MHAEHVPSPDYFDRQYAAIERRIKVASELQRRRKGWTIAGAGLVTSLALTGGAVAIIQATQTEKSVSVCYADASRTSESTEVGGGDIHELPPMDQRITAAEAQCASAWQIGVFDDGGPADGNEIAVPPLFTCVLADGRLGVFPAEGDVNCDSLGLREP